MNIHSAEPAELKHRLTLSGDHVSVASVPIQSRPKPRRMFWVGAGLGLLIGLGMLTGATLTASLNPFAALEIPLHAAATHGGDSMAIDGTKGAIEWHQEEPNKLLVRRNGEPLHVYTRNPNAPYMTDSGKGACRLPGGHPEAFFEAFANVYRSAYDSMARRATGQKFEARDTVYPNVYDGTEGMYFIQQCVASSKENGVWLPLKHPQARR